MLRESQGRRRGSILPLVVLSLVGMCGFVALAVDLGVIAVAKTQCQNSADAASMAGARSLDGSTTQNLGAVGTAGTAKDNAMKVAQANKVINDEVLSDNVTLRFGAWHYDTTTKLFVPQFPPVSPDNYNLCEVTVKYDVNTTFAQAFSMIDPGFNSVFTVTSVAQAAHRPRDVAIILDYSGSMNNESDLWNNEGYVGNGQTNTNNGYEWPKPTNANLTSNNAETVYPLFGHYKGSSTTAQGNSGNDYSDYFNNPNLLCPAAVVGNTLYNNSQIGKCNISQAASGIQAIVGDFYKSDRGAGSVQAAFTSEPDSYATAPDGDDYLPYTGSASPAPPFAQTVKHVFNSTAVNTDWESQGYKWKTNKDFKGYTLGPRYWGKTFFIWPPDPTNDWRKKFFFKDDGTTQLNDNTKLFKDAYPGYNDPAGHYKINYKEILKWVKNTGKNPFPTQLRAGYVLYYSAIPDDVPAAAYDHTKYNKDITDPDQRFWKEYIDYVLGVWRAPDGGIQWTQKPSCSIGPDFKFGAVKISAKPGDRYMDYDDNPWRPRHRLWFGPMTMVQFMLDTGILPGTAHDISTYSMKQGVGGALKDIQNNHPNDLVSMLLFHRPQFDNDKPGNGSFNRPQYNLTNSYAAIINSLWLPPNSGSADVRLWTSDGEHVPSPHGDWNANTSSSYGFMLAYNQFSGSSDLTVNNGTTVVGGKGRKGTTRLVIYETDGMANQGSDPKDGFHDGGAYNSYYKIRPGDKLDSKGYNETDLLKVVQAICNKDDKTTYVTMPTGYPTPPTVAGYATANKPVLVHCIAYGPVFDNAGSGSAQVQILQKISTIGSTVFPTSATDADNGYKWCTGTLSQRQSKIKTAFLKILNTSVPVSLIQ